MSPYACPYMRCGRLGNPASLTEAGSPSEVGIGPVGLLFEPRVYRGQGLWLCWGEHRLRLWGRRWEKRCLRRLYR